MFAFVVETKQWKKAYKKYCSRFRRRFLGDSVASKLAIQGLVYVFKETDALKKLQRFLHVLREDNLDDGGQVWE
jgi:hypothetical protein